MAKQKKITRPRDWSQRALSIVQQATGQIPKQSPQKKDPTAIKRGKLGGIKGGIARKKKLSSRQRTLIARKAAKSRWSK